MDTAKKTVLVVEDDIALRELCADALTEAGYHVLLAPNGQEGVTAALTHHPQIILMDIMMPIMDGHEATRHIRADEWGRTARIIYLTNLSDPENVFTAFEHGSVEYIIKSSNSIGEIVNKVRLAMYVQ